MGFCEEHGCPSIEIMSGVEVCPLEYVDNCIGSAEVLEVDNDPMSMVLDSGWRVPLLCPCGCGQGFVRNPKFDSMYAGLFVVSLSYHPERGDQREAIGIHFSEDPEGDVIEGASFILHLDSIRLMEKVGRDER